MALNINTNITNNRDGYLIDAKNVKGGLPVVDDVSDLAEIPAETSHFALVANDVHFDIYVYNPNTNQWMQVTTLGGFEFEETLQLSFDDIIFTSLSDFTYTNTQQNQEIDIKLIGFLFSNLAGKIKAQIMYGNTFKMAEVTFNTFEITTSGADTLSFTSISPITINNVKYYAVLEYNLTNTNVISETEIYADITKSFSFQEIQSGGGGVANLMTNVTYAEFLDLLENGYLIPGMIYRMTDFVTTCNGVYDLTLIGQSGAYLPYATSAEHPFDLLITATGTNTYNENVKAMLHNGDTYFANNNLAAWELKWTHLNDPTKYSWADGTNGKGVITWLRDEFNNIAYYDFKNIMNLQFALRRVDNTSSVGESFEYNPSTQPNRYGTLFDVFNVLQGNSIGNNLEFDVGDLNGTSAINLLVFISNVRKATLDSAMNWTYMLGGLSQMMGVTVTLATLAQLLGTTEEVLSAMTERQVIEQFFNGSFYYTFDCEGQDLSNYIDDNDSIQTVGGGYCHDNNLGHCADALTNFLSMQGQPITVIPNGLNIMTFEASFSALNCFGNEFGTNCFLNVFGSGCYSNKTEDYFYGNKFGNECFSNLFGNNCFSNTFFYSCYNNSFGNNCSVNSFDNCKYNSFGNTCHDNEFSNGCYDNSFGNDCVDNSFGNDCHHNSFGNACSFNSFGNTCSFNSFSDGCGYNYLGDPNSQNNLYDHQKYNIFENGVSYVELKKTTSTANYLQNVKICQGVRGTDVNNRLVIQATPNLDYQVAYKKTGSTEVNV